MSSDKEDFEVIILSEDKETETDIVTSKQLSERMLSGALNKYDSKNSQYSAYLSDGKISYGDLTPELLENLADTPQSDLKKILIINDLVRKEINKNDLVGITVSSLENNINTDYNVTYKDFKDRRNKKKAIDRTKELIDDFNIKINLKRLIRNSIPSAYSEGTYCIYLRNNNGKYVVDYYPLGVVIVSDYEVDGEPVLLIDIKELTNRIRKTVIRGKNRKPLFFDDIVDEIKANYSQEVYDAYVAKENYAKLDIRYSGILRVGNLNRKYGLTPIFRALESIMMLDTFRNADRVNTKAKAKKIIHQILNDKLLGQEGEKDSFPQMAYSHENLMDAWKQPTVVVTSPAYVKEIKYVEPQVELTNVDVTNQYRSSVMTCLGIGFLSQEGKQTVSTANISVEQLMLTINKIAEQLDDVINKWYVSILKDNGIDEDYAPTVKVVDAQQMSFEMKRALTELLYSKLGASYKTSFSILGIDIEDEKQRRVEENDNKFDEIFFPHPNSYTISDSADKLNPESNTGGRPKAKVENDKQVYDKNRVKST